MSGGRSSPESPHVYRGGFRLPKHLKSPLHLPEGEDGSAFGIGHASPLLHKCPTMTGLGSGSNSYSSSNINNGERAGSFFVLAVCSQRVRVLRSRRVETGLAARVYFSFLFGLQASPPLA